MQVTSSRQKYGPSLTNYSSLLLAAFLFSFDFAISVGHGVSPELSRTQRLFISTKCLGCHEGPDSEANFDLSAMLERGMVAELLGAWNKVHDRVASGEMPPDATASASQQMDFAIDLFPAIVNLDRQVIETQGRSILRRLNRFEFENSVRDLLSAPWLQLKTILPEDGELNRFNKVGEALDVSHVNLSRYMQAADLALRETIENEINRTPATTNRFYAREQSAFNRKVHFTVFNRSPERATFPLIGYAPDLDVLKDEKRPYTVGSENPEMREREAFGVVASSYEPIELRFNGFKAPSSGRYKLRFKGYTFWAAGEEKKWWRPDREKTSIGRRSEPVAVYSESPPRQLRRLGDVDFQIEPTVQELEVLLLVGESIRPDAVRLFRSRPSNWHNPLAEPDGMPGVAFNYLEVEGPIQSDSTSDGYRLLFDGLPIRNLRDKKEVVSDQPLVDAHRLMTQFVNRAYRNSVPEDVDRLMQLVKSAMTTGHSFQESMLAGYTAALCSPAFVCLEEPIGKLDAASIATRLSLLLWNTLPDASLRDIVDNSKQFDKEVLLEQTSRLLESPRSRQFVDAFLAYWLDLRRINDTSPDELLYPDYYLDDSLVDAALMETQLFFAEVIRENLPVRTLINADFTFANERLAKHYGLENFEGALLRKVKLPHDTPRGGLLTQASVLKVTANGTTTSPVVRGAWINERILGKTTPPPPKSVPAIEPDTRGATTIRQQLELHRTDTNCASCHAKIDPVGFALENFDVTGGWRDNYRSLGDSGEAQVGFGKNGQPFAFRKGPLVDASGALESEEKFHDIFELKALLVNQERSIARNLLNQFLIYATGARPRFSDRVEIEEILERLAGTHYPVRSMIEEVVCSRMFLNK